MTTPILKLAPAVEVLIIEQINAEFNAFYTYQAFQAHFDRHDVALKNTAAFFKKSAEEEIEHARMFISYLNKRGGTLSLKEIKAPQYASLSLLSAFEQALALERGVHDKLMHLHDCAAQENDPHVMDFVEGEFLSEQIDAEDILMRVITNIKRAGTGLGEYIVDKDITAITGE
jgi:ferritin